MGEAKRKSTSIRKEMTMATTEETGFPGPGGEHCGNCYFWVGDNIPGEIGQEQQGDCRKKSPTIFLVMGQSQVGAAMPVPLCYFPRTKKSKWCGEHRPREID
jgi:hypothetical protein